MCVFLCHAIHLAEGEISILCRILWYSFKGQTNVNEMENKLLALRNENCDIKNQRPV